MPSNIPLRNESFVGRDTLLGCVQDHLSANSPTKTIVLTGTGGIGKTQTALKFAWSQKSQFTTMLWLHSGSANSIRASYLDFANRIVAYYASLVKNGRPPYPLIAKCLGFEDLVDDEGCVTTEQKNLDRVAVAVNTWLESPKNTQWLAIYDGYDDPEVFQIRDYLPASLPGTIIVTSRRRDWAGFGRVIEVPLFEEEESLELLLRSSQKRAFSTFDDGLVVPIQLIRIILTS